MNFKEGHDLDMNSHRMNNREEVKTSSSDLKLSNSKSSEVTHFETNEDDSGDKLGANEEDNVNSNVMDVYITTIPTEEVSNFDSYCDSENFNKTTELKAYNDSNGMVAELKNHFLVSESLRKDIPTRIKRLPGDHNASNGDNENEDDDDLDVDIGSHSHHSRSEQQEISIQKRQPIALPIGFSSELTEALESKQFNCDCIILGDDT